MGSVECPACKMGASGGRCELCGGERYVSVDAAIGWRNRRGETIVPRSDVTRAVSHEDIVLLLDNVNMVLQALASMPTSIEVRSLVERALQCQGEVTQWESETPTRAEYDATAARVLGLHVAIRKLQQPE